MNKTKFESSVYYLDCGHQEYAWGKIGDKSAVYKLLSSQNYHHKYDITKPYAELWMGTHKNSPSYIVYKDQKFNLKDTIDQNPDKFLGSFVLSKFNNNKDLPFLFKVLSVDHALSIQAHPDKKLAEILFKKEPEHYKDDNYKPEMAYALTEYEALCRFCDKEQMIENIELVCEFKDLLNHDIYEQFRNETNYDELKKIFKSLFSDFIHVPEDQIKENLAVMNSRLQTKSKLTKRENLLLRLYKQYPGDIGVFVSLFLNYIVMQPGEYLVMEANEPHAYLSGNCLESMANSDNVVRLGLTPKFRDVETLKDMLTYELQKPTLKTGEYIHQDDNISINELCSGHVEFKCYNISITKQNTKTNNIRSQSPFIVIVTKGSGVLINEKEQFALKYGSILYICPNSWFKIKSLSDNFSCNICGVNEQSVELEQEQEQQ